MKPKDLVFLAAIAVGLYAINKAFGIGKKLGEGLSSVGSALGTGLYDLFHPDQTGEMLFYTVQFPNGARHAIPSRSVDKNGQFDYIQPPLAATRWQMLLSKDGKQRFAAPVK